MKWYLTGEGNYTIYIPSGFEVSNKSNSYAKTAISVVKELQIPVINIKNEVTDCTPTHCLFSSKTVAKPLQQPWL